MEYPSSRQSSWQRIGRGALLSTVSLLLIVWLLNTPEGLLGKADAIGYAVCHRIDLRSFHIGDRPLPLCARCSGMYLGAMLGLAYQAIVGRHRMGMPPKKVLFFSGLLVLAFGLDGINSFLSLIPGLPTLYTPNNSLRLLTGTGMGLVIALALFPAFNSSVWAKWDQRPAIGNLRSLWVLIGLGVLLDFVVLIENPMILYPLALISAAGVLILLTMVYTIVWLMLFRSENKYNRMSELFYPLMAGVAIALLQIGLLDLVRFGLTGTWDGFHLG